MSSKENKEKETLSDDLFTNENMIFCFTSNNIIDSAFIFKNGDILIFTGKGGVIFDSKTFKEKLIVNEIKLKRNFSLLSENEFVCLGNYGFGLYKFNENRTAYSIIQSFVTKELVLSSRVIKIINDDLLYSYQTSYNEKTLIYKKSSISGYEVKHSLPIIGFYELNENEVISIHYKYSIDKLNFSVFENKTYELIKNRRLDCIGDNQRIIYLSDPQIYIKNNKALVAGINKIFFFNLDTLSLETIIKLKTNILEYDLRPNGNLLLFTKKTGKVNSNEANEPDIFYLKELKFDSKTNEILKNKEKDISFLLGVYQSFFKIMSYSEKGILTIVDKERLVIYKRK